MRYVGRDGSCDVVSCELARQGVQRGAASTVDEGVVTRSV